MTTFVVFSIAMAVSVCAVFLLRSIDDKRRRIFFRDRERGAPAMRLLGWIGVLAPGLILFGSQQYSAFLSWFGMITVIGWLIAARAPSSRP